MSADGGGGEKKDVVFSNEKPQIFINSGTIIATTTASLKRSDFTYEVLEVTNMKTSLGYITIVRALSAGYVEIAGPTSSSQLEVLANLIAKYDVNTLYIDGALSRKYFASLSFVDEVKLVIGAAFNRVMSKTLDEALLWKKIFSLKTIEYSVDSCYNLVVNDQKYYFEFLDVDTFSSLVSEETTFIYLDCIVDSKLFNQILYFNRNRQITVVLKNANKLFINLNDFLRLSNSNLDLYVVDQLNINEVFVNPKGYGYDYDNDIFKSALEDIFDVNVINVGDKND